MLVIVGGLVSVVPTLLHHVPHVGLLFSPRQMHRMDAQAVIAQVHDHNPSPDPAAPEGRYTDPMSQCGSHLSFAGP
jgi:hypothetical protein